MSATRHARIGLLAAALATTVATTLAACATRGTGASSHVTPPVALERLPYDDFDRGGSEFTIEVMVDSLGRADPRTLRVVGTVGTNTRTAIERWAGYARFTPAKQDGHAVAALYHTQIKSTVRVERRGL